MMGGRVTAYANLGTALHRVAHLKARAFSQVAVQGVQPIVVFKDEVVTPSLEEQFVDMEENRNAVCAQFIDRSQLRVVGPNELW